MHDADCGCWWRSWRENIGRKGEVDRIRDADEDQQDDADP
jgi:hypothetical protein